MSLTPRSCAWWYGRAPLKLGRNEWWMLIDRGPASSGRRRRRAPACSGRARRARRPASFTSSSSRASACALVLGRHRQVVERHAVELGDRPAGRRGCRRPPGRRSAACRCATGTAGRAGSGRRDSPGSACGCGGRPACSCQSMPNPLATGAKASRSAAPSSTGVTASPEGATSTRMKKRPVRGPRTGGSRRCCHRPRGRRPRRRARCRSGRGTTASGPGWRSRRAR